MKKIIILLIVLLTGCTIVKFYSGNPPYYEIKTDIYLNKQDSDKVDIDSILINGGEPYLIIQNNGFLYDITGRRIK